MATACVVNSGQACMAGNRLFLHADFPDEVVERLVAHIRGLTLGDGMVPGTALGPLILPRQNARVLDYIALGLAAGARRALGEAPVLFINCHAGMRIVHEEIFGPVLSVLRFTDEAAMRRDMRNTVYGLSGSVWPQDIQRALGPPNTSIPDRSASTTTPRSARNALRQQPSVPLGPRIRPRGRRIRPENQSDQHQPGRALGVIRT